MSKVEEEVVTILKLLKSLEKDSDRAAPGPAASSCHPCSPDLDDLLRLLLLLLLFAGNGNGLSASCCCSCSCSHAESSGRSP